MSNDKKEFIKLLKKHPECAEKIKRILSSREPIDKRSVLSGKQ